MTTTSWKFRLSCGANQTDVRQNCDIGVPARSITPGPFLCNPLNYLNFDPSLNCVDLVTNGKKP